MEKRENIIADLLLRWEESYEHGSDIKATELCKDHPELTAGLQAKIDNLKKMSWMTDSENGQNENDPDEFLNKTLGGRYRIESLIAHGGFGRVYKAFDPELERHVAIKVPSRTDESNGQVDSLVEEARRVAKLRHPGIVYVHDVGKDDGRYFIVSELINGFSLAETLTTKLPSVRESVLLVAEIAENLQVAHDTGFVHRDIKPANILIDEKGKPLITDFGIASTHDDKSASTKGTLPYMAPEQVANEPQLIDRRADIYSLGVVLYELLTGESPYSARTPGTLREQILFRPPKPFAASSVSQPIQNVCLKCLSKHPADRYESADELAVALRHSLTTTTEFTNLRKWLPSIALGLIFAACAFVTGRYFNPTQSNALEGGINFDGTSRIITPITNFAPVTIETWIASSNINMTEDQFVVGSDVSGHYGIGIGIQANGHPMVETVRGGSHATRYRVPSNRWSHLAAVYGSEQTRLYLNGKLVATCDPTNQPEVPSPFVIGSLGVDLGTMCFQGKLKSVRISKGMRFKEEFIPDNDFNVGDKSNALLIYDESSFSGDKIIDLSGNRNHGKWDSVLVSPDQGEQDSEIAKMILEFGGEVEILNASGRTRLFDTRKIPPGDFYLTEVKLMSNAQFNDMHLEKLRGLRRLEYIYLTGSSITDDGMDVFSSMDTLLNIGVGSSAITDQGIAKLVDLPRLVYLSVGNTKITDDVFSSLSKIKNLRQLHIPVCAGLTEAAVEEFKKSHPNCFVEFYR